MQKSGLIWKLKNPYLITSELPFPLTAKVGWGVPCTSVPERNNIPGLDLRREPVQGKACAPDEAFGDSTFNLLPFSCITT
ncbi:hypothetical protein VTL71DRAFT_13911 [Oculimacula yallundae]|uniref:Uncharacterized protein n=1 Tax=Oculimacula yallundae TaxID=86028 RepID=A0ABR4CM50_9HELO